MNELKLKHPFTCICAGTTGSGKTYWTRNLLENWSDLIDINVEIPKVLWCYGQIQRFPPISNVDVEYYRGLPTEEYILKKEDEKEKRPNIIVLDDLMGDMKTNDNIKSLFTQGSHHNGISVIYIVQNLFNHDKNQKTISINTHYVVVMKSIRLMSQIFETAKQSFPGKTKDVMEAYKRATEKKFGYLLFDFHPTQINKFCLRTRIFNYELPEELREEITSSPIIYEIT
jgi:hypothetical protein